MLHYLVTYVRDSLDKESLDSVPTGQRLSGGGAELPPTRVDPAIALTPEEIQSIPATDPVPSTPVPAGHSKLPTPPATKQEEPKLRPGMTAIVLLVGTLTVSSSVGCACFRKEKVDGNVVSARQLSLRGIDALQRGQWDDAESLFANALQKNPTDERAHRHFAEVLWHRGERKSAIRHQEKSVRLSGGDPSLLVQLGEMYLKEGNIEAAEECADEAIDGNRELCGAWALRGDIHRQRNAPNEAMECYHRALSLQPHYPHVQLSLANLYQQANRPQRALATLSALAGQYQPGQVPAEVEFQRGLTLKSLKRYEDAVETLTAAATAAGEPSADLLFHLSEAQFLAGNIANSRLALQAALASVPNHSASLKLRDKLERHGQAMTAAVERK